jgi:hypothetical protein
MRLPGEEEFLEIGAVGECVRRDAGDAGVLHVDGPDLGQLRQRRGGHEVHVAVGPHHQLEPGELGLRVEGGPHGVLLAQLTEHPARRLQRRLRVVDVAVAVEQRVRRHVADVGTEAALLGRLGTTARRLGARRRVGAQRQDRAHRQQTLAGRPHPATTIGNSLNIIVLHCWDTAYFVFVPCRKRINAIRFLHDKIIIL